MNIGIDIMGGDKAPSATIGGAIIARKELPESDHLFLFGDEKIITEALIHEGADPAAFNIVHAPETIGMGEHATKAISQKPNSGIALGFKYLKKSKIDAFASAGNTGAMLVGSIFSVNTVQGVIRPCITSILPKENGNVGILLDVGAVPDCRPDILYQFGILGSLCAQYVYNIKNPKVGLLNIGEEEEKGNLLTQAAFRLMKSTKDFNFIGNVESRDLFKDKADVIVCDGFSGNIALKQTEALYRMVTKRGYTDEFFKRLNYENYGGTPILGINSTVIIGHGISNDIAIKNMILLAKDVFEAKLSKRIKIAMANYISAKENETNS